MLFCLVALVVLTVVSCHGNNEYSGGTFQSQQLPVQSNVLDGYDASSNGLSSRFGIGFTSQQLSSNTIQGGQYANSMNRNRNYIHGADLGAWNSYSGGNHVIKKRFVDLPQVSLIQKQHNDALLENQKLYATLQGMGQISGNIMGNDKIVDKYNSKLGRALAKNEKLASNLHGIVHGADTLVVHGEVLDSQNHVIGKAIAKNQRLSARLGDVLDGSDSLLVQGSKRKALKQVQKANASLMKDVARAKKERQRAQAETRKLIKQENNQIRKEINQARKERLSQQPVIMDNARGIISLQTAGSLQQSHIGKPLVIDMDHPIKSTLAGNKPLGVPGVVMSDSNGQISIVDKYKSNIGKGLQENERLTKKLNDLLYGGDTLVVHGQVLDMQDHPIGNGLTKNDKLNKKLFDIQNGSDTIVVHGSKVKLMKEIRRANALLRKQIIEAKQQNRRQKLQTLKEVRKDNAQLKNEIRRSQ